MHNEETFRLYLYAYLVILNIFVVPDDAQRLVKSQ